MNSDRIKEALAMLVKETPVDSPRRRLANEARAELSNLEAAAKVLLDSGLQGNTASKHEVAQRIRSLKRGQS